MLTFYVSTSRECYQVGDFFHPKSSIGRYTLGFGYDASMADSKIKLLVKAIRSKDFSEFCHDYAHPTVSAKAFQETFAPLLGRKGDCLTKIGPSRAYLFEGFVPHPSQVESELDPMMDTTWEELKLRSEQMTAYYCKVNQTNKQTPCH